MVLGDQNFLGEGYVRHKPYAMYAEYNIKIWKPTFLENRISNPLLFKFINNVFIPCFAGVMGLYYGWTRGEQLKQAFWTLGMPQATVRAQ